MALGMLAGCGGGGGRAAGGAVPTDRDGRPLGRAVGSVSVTIPRPAPSPSEVTAQGIPFAASSFRIRVEDPNTANQLLAPEMLLAFDMDSPVTGPLTAQFDNIRVGPVIVRVLAFSTSTGTGTPMATAMGSANVGQGQQASVQILLAAIETLTIFPDPATVGLGSTTSLFLQATDANDNSLFVVPGTITWRSDDPSIVTVDAQGVLTGVQFGTTTVRARDNNPPNREATVTVRVGQIP